MERPARVGLVGRERKCKISGYHFLNGPALRRASGLSGADRSVLMGGQSIAIRRVSTNCCGCGSLPRWSSFEPCAEDTPCKDVSTWAIWLGSRSSRAKEPIIGFPQKLFVEQGGRRGTDCPWGPGQSDKEIKAQLRREICSSVNSSHSCQGNHLYWPIPPQPNFHPSSATMTSEVKTEFLVVGAGPAGAALASFLGQNGRYAQALGKPS